MGQTDPEWELGGWGARVKAGTQNQRGRGDERTVHAGQREARRSGSRRPDSGLWAPSSASGWRVAWSAASPLSTAQGCISGPFLLVPTHPPSLLGCITGPHPEAPLHPGMHSFRGLGGQTGRPRRVFAQEPGARGQGTHHPDEWVG